MLYRPTATAHLEPCKAALETPTGATATGGWGRGWQLERLLVPSTGSLTLLPSGGKQRLFNLKGGHAWFPPLF